MHLFHSRLRRVTHLSGVVLFALSSQLAMAGAPTETLNKYACSGCHGMTAKVVGPGFNEVAAKYKNQKDAKAHLTTRIKAGGSGVWGQIAMPPQPAITEAELTTVVDWLLAGAAP